MLRLLLTLSLPLYLSDQATKALILRYIPTHESLTVIPGFFNLVQVHNTGAAFGMMKGNNVAFIALATVALVLLTIFAKRGAFPTPLMRVGAALLASGILGNLTDRILHGHVIDFLDVILPWYGHWPVFNIADSCICIAAVFFVWASFLPEPKAAAPA